MSIERGASQLYGEGADKKESLPLRFYIDGHPAIRPGPKKKYLLFKFLTGGTLIIALVIGIIFRWQQEFSPLYPK